MAPGAHVFCAERVTKLLVDIAMRFIITFEQRVDFEILNISEMKMK